MTSLLCVPNHHPSLAKLIHLSLTASQPPPTPHLVPSPPQPFRPHSSRIAPPTSHPKISLSHPALWGTPFDRGSHIRTSRQAYWPVSDGGRFAPQPAKRGRKRWLLIGGIVLGAIALIGIIAGVLVSRKKGGPSSSSSSSANTRTSNLGNPSDFAKDPKLHQSFYGFAYTPNVGRSSVRAH